MKVVLFANNHLGAHAARWIAERAEIVALVMHDLDNRRCMDGVAEELGLEDRVILASELKDPATLERIRGLAPDLGLSVLFGHIIRPNVLDLFPAALNLHPSYLPWNRGNYPDVWAIIDGTPAGATLHHMDATLDTGDIVAQAEVPVLPHDTAQRLYGRCIEAAKQVLRDIWPVLESGNIPRHPQTGDGSYHLRSDVEDIDLLDLDATMRVGDLIDRLRARTFPPYLGCHYDGPDGRIYLRLDLIPEDA